MKYARYLRVPKHMVEDETTTITTLLAHEVDYFKKRQAKKSHVWRDLQIQMGEHGLDFRENKVTIYITAKQYKAPRIAFKN